MNNETIFTLLRWLVPASFALHIVEEFFFPGGFIEWYHGYRPQVAGSKPAYYIKANAVYLTATLLGPLGVHAEWAPYSHLFSIGVLTCNFFFTHVRGMFVTKKFSPGSITGALFYVPLAIVSYVFLLSTGRISVAGGLTCLALSPVLEIWFMIKKNPATAAA